MPTLKIPTPLRTYTSGHGEVTVQGATVGGALEDLIVQFPALRPHLMTEDGRLRAFVNLFVGEHNIKDLDGLDTPLAADAQARIIPSIAGGCPDSPCSPEPQGQRILSGGTLSDQ